MRGEAISVPIRDGAGVSTGVFVVIGPTKDIYERRTRGELTRDDVCGELLFLAPGMPGAARIAVTGELLAHLRRHFGDLGNDIRL